MISCSQTHDEVFVPLDPFTIRVSIGTRQLNEISAHHVRWLVLEKSERVVGVPDLVGSIANVGEGGEEASDVRFG